MLDILKYFASGQDETDSKSKGICFSKQKLFVILVIRAIQVFCNQCFVIFLKFYWLLVLLNKVLLIGMTK